MFGWLLSLHAHLRTGGKKQCFMHPGLACFLHLCVITCQASNASHVICVLTHLPLGLQAVITKMGAIMQQHSQVVQWQLVCNMPFWAPTDLKTLTDDPVTTASSAAAASRV